MNTYLKFLLNIVVPETILMPGYSVIYDMIVYIKNLITKQDIKQRLNKNIAAKILKKDYNEITIGLFSESYDNFTSFEKLESDIGVSDDLQEGQIITLES